MSKIKEFLEKAVEKPKWWLITAGESYYPSRGIQDWLETFESLEDALANVIDTGRGYVVGGKSYDWVVIVNLEELILTGNATSTVEFGSAYGG